LSYKHFSNTECEYYPCHGLENQNCLFCYCPLYFFEDCGGDPKWNGNVKDCSNCEKNHNKNSYEFVMSRLGKAFGNLKDGMKMLKLED
jgi:Zn-finger protein